MPIDYYLDSAAKLIEATMAASQWVGYVSGAFVFILAVVVFVVWSDAKRR